MEERRVVDRNYERITPRFRVQFQLQE